MKRYLLGFLFVLASFHFEAQSNEFPEGLIKKHGLSKKDIAYHVIDLESGKITASHNAARPMILASVTKALSMYYALSVLGPDFKFKTKLLTKGTIKKGALQGDIVLEGGGDPYLTPAHLMSMALALKEKGISKVKGRFVFDQSALPFVDRISPFFLDDQAYNTSVGALNADFNRFEVFKNKRTLPLLEHLEVKKGKGRLPLGLTFKSKSSEEEDGEIWLFGKKSKRSYVEDLPARNAGLFAASYFQYLCSLLKIELPAPEEGLVPKKANTIYTHESLPLIRLAALALEYSNNLFAEVPALMASKRLTGKKKGLKASSDTMKKWFKDSFKQINFESASFSNASGLSIENAMSGKSLTELLAAVHDKSFGHRRYWSLLSINGKSGWLADRLDRPKLAFRIWAKTGSLDYVNNIAGYYLDKSGNQKAFSLLLNNHDKRKLLNSPLSKKAFLERKRAGKWNRQAKNFMDELLESWIQS